MSRVVREVDIADIAPLDIARVLPSEVIGVGAERLDASLVRLDQIRNLEASALEANPQAAGTRKQLKRGECPDAPGVGANGSGKRRRT